MTTLLIEFGADINARDYLNKTPLAYAIEQKNDDIITLLTQTPLLTHVGTIVNLEDTRNRIHIYMQICEQIGAYLN